MGSSTGSLLVSPGSPVDVIVSVPGVGAVVSTVILPDVVESADVTVLVAKSVTSARTEYVVPLVSAAAVTVYAVPPPDGAVNVALSTHVVPPSVLTRIPVRAPPRVITASITALPSCIL